MCGDCNDFGRSPQQSRRPLRVTYSPPGGVFATAEFAIFASLLSLQAWLAPHTGSLNWIDFLQNSTGKQVLLTTLAYAMAVAFLEPFYVAAGFGMYLNRRVELEAWDVEQELRRAFAS